MVIADETHVRVGALLLGAAMLAVACDADRAPASRVTTAPTLPSPSSTAPPATQPPADPVRIPQGVALPAATHAHAPLAVDGDVPTVAVTGDRVYVDGAAVGDTRPIAVVGRPQRIDGLFDAMKGARELWKSVHSGNAFPGIALFAFDRSASALVVKSVFQTAAFAGYPNAYLAVRGGSSEVEHFDVFDVDAVVPMPGGVLHGDTGNLRLLVAVRQATWLVVWQKGPHVITNTEVPSLADLEATVAKEWKSRGLHREKTDTAFDQAVLYVADDVDYGGIVAALDAIAATTRDAILGGRTERVPAFNVTLTMAREIATGAR